MKSIIVAVFSVIGAIFIGSLFMNVASTEEENTTPAINTSSILKAFQVGAYKTEDSAKREAKLKGGIVASDGDYYYVYVSLLQEPDNIEKMINYLDDKNYYYYVKNIPASGTFLKELYKYEELMKGTTSKIAFLELNKRILEMYNN